MYVYISKIRYEEKNQNLTTSYNVTMKPDADKDSISFYFQYCSS